MRAQLALQLIHRLRVAFDTVETVAALRPVEILDTEREDAAFRVRESGHSLQRLGHNLVAHPLGFEVQPFALDDDGLGETFVGRVGAVSHRRRPRQGGI